MFTGLVQEIGVIRSVDRTQGDLCAEIETSMDLDTVPVGASICCSGCCLTVTQKSVKSFFVDISQETLSRTNLGAWEVMTRVNLERSLKMGDELGGHFVFGHVDGVAEILDVREEGGSQRIRISLPLELARYVAPKGSITVDGISLTVNEVGADFFGVNIIPHTWAQTTLGGRVAGDKVNLEIDMLARYVARMMDIRV